VDRHKPIWTHETLHIFTELLIVDHSVHFGHSDLGLMSHCIITWKLQWGQHFAKHKLIVRLLVIVQNNTLLKLLFTLVLLHPLHKA